ncbi:hypothetical protein U3516DRAFT_788724 [Neocallimastix sp. 'constans']
MPIDGIEPPTFALQERRSTTKPNRHFDESNEWGHILDIYWTYIGTVFMTKKKNAGSEIRTRASFETTNSAIPASCCEKVNSVYFINFKGYMITINVNTINMMKTTDITKTLKYAL